VTDTLTIQIDASEWPSTWGYEVNFLINDVPLWEVVRELMPPDDDPSDWVALPLEVPGEHPDHLMGGPDRWEDPVDPYYDDPALLACGCSYPGCGALIVHIEVGEENVRWDRLRLGQADDEVVVVGQVGPFVFERRQYDDAVGAIRSFALSDAVIAARADAERAQLEAHARWGRLD
jgi:hypothetical protein